MKWQDAPPWITPLSDKYARASNVSYEVFLGSSMQKSIRNCLGTSISVTRTLWIPLGPCIWKWSRSCRTCFLPRCDLSPDESVWRMAASWPWTSAAVVILRATPRLGGVYSDQFRTSALKNTTYSWSAMSCANHTVEKAPWPNFWRILYRGRSLLGHNENVSPRCTGWNPPGL